MTGLRSRPTTRVPGEVGVWVFVLGDMAVFAVCFGIIAVTRALDPQAYAASAAQLHLAIGVANTTLLLTSSLLLALGVHAARTGGGGRGGAPARLLAATIGCAVAFVALKVAEYALLFGAGLTPRTDDYFHYYFGFTGLHLLHVLIGLVVLGGILRIVRRRSARRADLAMVENGAVYWHMVDLLWLVLFGLLYLTG